MGLGVGVEEGLGVGLADGLGEDEICAEVVTKYCVPPAANMESNRNAITVRHKELTLCFIFFISSISLPRSRGWSVREK